jgi:hypothetical protein
MQKEKVKFIKNGIALHLPILLLAILAVMTLGIVAYAQSSEENDLRESFDNHLNIYRISLERKPKGYEDFESFVLEVLPGQNPEKPGLDSLGRSPIGGWLRLVDGTVFPVRSAFMRINKDKKYEWLVFETAEVKGKCYRFDGHFLRRRVEDRRSVDTYLRGTLTLIEAGKKKYSKNLPFTIYADL